MTCFIFFINMSGVVETIAETNRSQALIKVQPQRRGSREFRSPTREDLGPPNVVI